jgi:hypothetical protein
VSYRASFFGPLTTTASIVPLSWPIFRLDCRNVAVLRWERLLSIIAKISTAEWTEIAGAIRRFRANG